MTTYDQHGRPVYEVTSNAVLSKAGRERIQQAQQPLCRFGPDGLETYTPEPCNPAAVSGLSAMLLWGVVLGIGIGWMIWG